MDLDLKKLIDMREPLSDKDEYFHDLTKLIGEFPKHHNESWYFNFLDIENDIYFVTRLSVHMDIGKSRMLCLLVIDGERNTYFHEMDHEKLPENWEFDPKAKYYCIEPMNKWRVIFEDRKFNLDVTLEGRFPVMNFADIEDPKTVIEKYGEEFLKTAAQEHYEQPTIATGVLELKKRSGKVREVYETRNIKGFGQRDHSWGIRHWVQIDSWNWCSAQFEDMTINFFKTNLMGKSPQAGVIYTNDGNTILEDIEVTTKTKEDGKTPVSSTFVLTDRNGKKRILESKTINSIYLPLPTPGEGKTEIFEQVVIFTCEGKEGNGISEYLISTRN